MKTQQKDISTTKYKLTWLLILQAWAMLWVVIGHSPISDIGVSCGVDKFAFSVSQHLRDFAYSFHMPLFIMISGYLFYRTKISKREPFKKMITAKMIRLGIPYIAFITLAIVMKFVTGGGTGS